MTNPFVNLQNKAIERNIEVVFKRYFCPKTELLYEFVVDEENNAWFHLPTPEHIKKSVPNPCGWGTGMEDSAMNGGCALDACISAYEITKNAQIIPCADAICRGLLRCSSGQRDKGFVARSVSPFDGKSHYIESSRDQYTHWLCSLVNYYDCEMCDHEMKDKIKTALINTAEKCVRDVTKENDYNMLREDGTIGRVNKMWDGIATHEWTRLPAIYLAAYHATREDRWKKYYMIYRDEAIEKSSAHNPEAVWGYPNLQMQYSLRLLYNYDNDVAVKSKIKQIMEKIAVFSEKRSIEYSKEYCQEKYLDQLNFRFHKWNVVAPLRQGIINGYNYDNPNQSANKGNLICNMVREIGEYAITAAICPDYKIESRTISAVTNMAEKIDLKRHSSIYAHLLLPCAYAICLENKMKYK